MQKKQTYIDVLIQKTGTVCRLILGLFRSLFTDGPKVTLQRFKWAFRKIAGRFNHMGPNDYYFKDHWPSEEELQRQRNHAFDEDITFSIIVPLYNTPPVFLREMIDSVVAQTYGKWQLCLADGSNTNPETVTSIVKEYQSKDARISYTKVVNEGISQTSNACLRMAEGNWILLFDHDDVLHPSALYKCMEQICEKGADFIYSDEMVFEGSIHHILTYNFKSDFAIDTLRSHNYICHLSAFSADLWKQVGDFRPAFNGSQDYDMVLRLSEKAECIVHIPEALYFWRSHPGSVASDVSVKPYCMESAQKALAEHLKRMEIKGTVRGSKVLSTYKIDYDLIDHPLVSIIVDHPEQHPSFLQCMKTLFEKSTYPHIEVICMCRENDADVQSLEKIYKSFHPLMYREKDAVSARINAGVQSAKGSMLVLMHDDVEVITPDWIEEMMMYAQRSDIGAVQGLLYYENDTVQNAGLILGLHGVVGYPHRYYQRDSIGYIHRLSVAQNLSAVSKSCMMIKRTDFEEMNGLCEAYRLDYDDVDLCARLREKGKLHVFTPYAKFYHFESMEYGYADTKEKKERQRLDEAELRSRWKHMLEKTDPYYNPNFTTRTENFDIHRF